jgi:DNA-binding transcriptional regulator YhcF (GntR family)
MNPEAEERSGVLELRSLVCCTMCTQGHMQPQELRTLVTDDPPGTPEWKRVRDDLRRRIASSELPEGSQLPSTTALQETYKVSSTVTRRAINELKSSGLVYGVSGKGVFVAAGAAGAGAPEAGMDIATGLDRARKRLDALPTEHVPADEVAAIRRDVEELRRHLAFLETNLMDLYRRQGVTYPHRPDAADFMDDEERGAS